MNKIKIITILLALNTSVGCALFNKKNQPENEWKYDNETVKDITVFEKGSEKDAVVPDVSAPKLRAIWVPEKVENGRLIEAHREWILEGNSIILGIPKSEGNKK